MKAQAQSLGVEDEAPTEMQAQTWTLEAKGEAQLEATAESSCRVGGIGTETTEVEEVEAAEEAVAAEMAIAWAIEAAEEATAGMAAEEAATMEAAEEATAAEAAEEVAAVKATEGYYSTICTDTKI